MAIVNRLLQIQSPFYNNRCWSQRIICRKVSFKQIFVFLLVIFLLRGMCQRNYPPNYPSVPEKNSGLVPLHDWTCDKSRDLSDYIHPNNFTAIIHPKSICNDETYLLIIVSSAVKNFDARMAIRNTWGNQTHLDLTYNTSIRIAFLMGESKNHSFNSYLMEESLLHKDVIQESFLDSYNNLTLKSAMLLKWVTTNCKKVPYIMKIDDDMFLNVPNLFKVLNEQVNGTNLLIGSLLCNTMPIRDPKNKWYIPKYMYPEQRFPNYLCGTGYVMSQSIASELYQMALTIPLLHLEDVFFTGVCAKKAGFRPANQKGFNFGPQEIEPCQISEVITIHKINPSKMYTLWSKFNDASTYSVFCVYYMIVNQINIVLEKFSKN